MVVFGGVEVSSLARSPSGEILPWTVPPECADPKSPSLPLQVVQAFRRFGAVTGGKLGIAFDMLAKRPENEPPELVYERRVVASTGQDKKVDSGDDK